MYSKLDIQFNRAIYLIKNAGKILIVGHKKPDSDTIGSSIALSVFLDKLGKENIVSFFDPVPPRFSFLPKTKEIMSLASVMETMPNFDLIITLDCGSYTLTGLDNYLPSQTNISLINIDHHQDSFLGTLNIVDVNVSSTAEIIYNLFFRLKFVINSQIASALLCGIFGDTDSFKNPNTTEKTLQITSDLLAAGADLKEVIKNNLSDKSVNTLRLWGKVLSRLKKNEKSGIVFTVVTKDDIKENNASFADIEGIANFLNSIPESKGALVLSEKEDGEIKGSLRTLSKNIDVAKIARIFGGGGHKKAAGFTINGKIMQEDKRWRII